ncbi:MAG: hypothetical protein DME19_03490 [Verrucomicrobia bacterium]|nr:MAG: hypothetical protein DME19_03490 [Verrucomicrobiota bacterium]
MHRPAARRPKAVRVTNVRAESKLVAGNNSIATDPRSRRRDSAHLLALKAKDWRRLTSAATVQGLGP